MNIIELSKFIQDEEAAEKYLFENGILKTWTNCPYCNSDKIGRISRGRVKCYKCKKEWHKRKGSFLEGKQISCSKFIAFLKLYADEIGINQITSELVLNKKTAIYLVKEIRNNVIPDSITNDTHESNCAIIFEKNDSVHLAFNSQTNQKNVCIINFERYKEQGNLYSFMIKSTSSKKGRHKMNSVDRFLSFAKMKLITYRGIKLDYLKEYLTELVVKYNLKDQDFFEYLVKSLHFLKVANITPSSRKLRISGEFL